MLLRIAKPTKLVYLVAGLGSLLFEKLGAIKPTTTTDPDDLTVISGIGPTFARRLHEAGVLTFADLAALSEAELKAITQAAEWQADPADWIHQAQMLS